MADKVSAVIEKALDDWLAAKIGHLMGVLFQGMATGDPEDALARMVLGARMAVAAWDDARASIPEMIATSG